MYERIVLAYDGSREGLVALREGALLARRFGSKVYLLSVLPQSEGVRIAESVSGDLLSPQMVGYKELLARGVTVLKDLGFDPVARLAVGEPAPLIGAFSLEVKADLIVLGHRKQNLLQRWWSGSTGAFISDQVTCSVLIGRTPISDEAFADELKA
jgi:nucleotide-binding universal stress UspA family protein